MLRWLPLVFILMVGQAAPLPSAQQNPNGEGTLARRYTVGSVLRYRMTGNNDGWQYTIESTHVVKRDTSGHCYEEIGWSSFTSNAQQALTPVSLALRQTVSLDDPATYMKMPDLANVQPLLIGPIADTLTLYSDLLLAIRAKLSHPGQTAYVARPAPNSWADGQRVLLGQDAVDFSFKVEAVNAAENTETLLVQHVPPPALHVELPAPWMRSTAAAGPNNFVQVSRQDDGFTAEAGRETFDVRLTIDTRDGHILSAAMHNPVVVTIRSCRDRELTQCGPGAPKAILRDITWQLLP